MAQLRRFENEFQERGVQIVLLAFGSPYWARVFLEEVGVDYPMLLDPEREVYRRYGLGRNLLGAFSPQVIWYYIKAIVAGRPVRLFSEGDKLQLGGDVVVGKDGRILMSHHSREPTDRPTPHAILRKLDTVLASGQAG